MTCAQSVNLLQNSEMFKNEIKNRQKLKIINKGLMLKLLAQELGMLAGNLNSKLEISHAGV